MIIFVILMILLFIWLRKKPRNNNSTERYYSPDIPQGEASLPEDKNDFSHEYQRKYIFSRNEKSEYRKLVSWAQEHGYDVFPKMRLADIIEPRSKENYRSLLGKIIQKHVDFVVCDQECRVKFIIELDDNSHYQQARKARDEFVDQACRGAGYFVIHTKGISEEFLNSLLFHEKEKHDPVEWKQQKEVK